MAMEPIIRPFIGPGTDPQPFHPAGTIGVPDVHVSIGLKGGTKTFSYSGSSTVGTKMGNAHKEKAPLSPALQSKLSSANSG